MTPRQSMLGWGSVLLAMAALCASVMLDAGHSRAAQDADNDDGKDAAEARLPDEFMPAEAILYASWDGQSGHEQAFQKTAAYQAIYETGLAEGVASLVSQLISRGGDEAALAGEVLKTVAANGFSISVSATGQGQPLLWAVLVLHGAADLEPPLGDAIRNEAPPQAEFDKVDVEGRTVTVVRHSQVPIGEATWWTEGGHLVIAFGLNATQQTIDVLEGRRENVTTNQLFQPPENLGFDANCIAWLDVERLLGAVGTIRVPSPDRGDPPVAISELVAAFGLDDIRSYVMRSGFAGKACRSDIRVELVEEPDGVGTLFDVPAFALDDLPPLPESTSGFSAGAFNADAIFDWLAASRDALRAYAPESATRDLDRMAERVREELDIDIRAGLVEPLGNLGALYIDEGQSPSVWGLTMVLAVDDANQLRSSLAKVGETLSRRFKPKELTILSSEKSGQDVVTFEIAGGMFNPSYAVTEEWLAVSVLPQNIETFLLREEGALPKWTPSEAITQATESLPHEFTGLSISDPTPAVRALYGMVPVFGAFIRAGLSQNMAGPPIDWNVGRLPPTELVTRHLFPNVAVTTRQDTTIVCQSRSSLPSFPLAGGGGSMGAGTSAVLVALLLPAVQAARSAARRTQSMNNLKQIGLALHNYHDNDGRFPSGTVEESAKKVEKRLSWQASLLPFLEQGPLHDDIDFEAAWDSDANEKESRVPIPTFINSGVAIEQKPGDPAPTHYVGIAGVGKKAPTLPVTDPKAGMFGYERVARLADVIDGTSNTVMVSEATDDSVGPWAQGGKSTVRALTKKPYINGPDGIGGPYPGGCNMLLVDGAVRFVSENIDPEVMEGLSTISGGEVPPVGF